MKLEQCQQPAAVGTKMRALGTARAVGVAAAFLAARRVENAHAAGTKARRQPAAVGRLGKMMEDIRQATDGVLER
ncbi:MAG: hypothetical protein NOF05_21770 [Candidatus Accumulibacter phosphatis]|nr:MULTISPECIES: hypothetical protein [Candidatus Accumulibacter]MBL8399507.1 hypothetical protein [Accumulibacter sp.]MCC2867115.1 hypothetical protein [Candidatus Accumulibacter phosphatis]MCM8622591.1 hypothetical protein [Accumulibacter sp.]MCQ1551376.1 hypothetical protein [Candidatus Accumulibacter phosphatis]HNI74750.1 hypothetical protein [Accumulibacter sp.]